MGNGYEWTSYSVFIIKSIEALQKDFRDLYKIVQDGEVNLNVRILELRKEIYNDFAKLNIEVARLQVKAAIIGGLLGALVTIFGKELIMKLIK